MRTYIHLIAFIALLTMTNRRALADEPADLKPLLRFYNTDSEQHYYTLSAAEAEQWRSRSDLQEEHAIGRVTHRPLDGTVKLHRATFENGKYHSYFTGPEKSVPLPSRQTDAPINPGNSGGPMFDERGPVIGLVSQKGNLEGVGFAIPASVLRQFLESTQQK